MTLHSQELYHIDTIIYFEWTYPGCTHEQRLTPEQTGSISLKEKSREGCSETGTWKADHCLKQCRVPNANPTGLQRKKNVPRGTKTKRADVMFILFK